jgi:hypothetical protein
LGLSCNVGCCIIVCGSIVVGFSSNVVGSIIIVGSLACGCGIIIGDSSSAVGSIIIWGVASNAVGSIIVGSAWGDGIICDLSNSSKLESVISAKWANCSGPLIMISSLSSCYCFFLIPACGDVFIAPLDLIRPFA